MASYRGIRAIPFEQRKTINQIISHPVMRSYASLRLEECVDKTGANGCWEWTEKTQCHGGYGRFSFGRGNLVRAHRLAYALANGPIADELVIRHQCDNPKCCNPSHLIVGTQLENVRDAISRGRNSPPPVHRGSSHPKATLSDQQIRDIRAEAGTYTALSQKYHVSVKTISRIKKLITRKEA